MLTLATRTRPRIKSSFMRSGSTKAQVTLPRLPIPPLRKTLDRYLASIQPLLLEDEVRTGTPFDSAYDLRVKWAEEFELGLGSVCQERLHAIDRISPNNWLDDNFWLNKAYLEWRAPLPINSNWWLAFNNDKQVPEHVLRGGASTSAAGITPWQVRRATWVLHRILDFKDRLDNTQELHPETTRTGVWLRDNVSKMFNVARIPKLGCDTLSDRCADAKSGKVLVMIHDWCYTVDVYEPELGAPRADDDPPTQTLLSPGIIESRLRQIVYDVQERLLRGERAVPVGLLSSDDRDIWAKNLSRLLSLSSQNERIYETILGSLMALSLDDWTHTHSPNTPHTSPYPLSPIDVDTAQEINSHLHNIRSSSSAHNRWFDKPLTLIVEPNSRAGAMGEHSPCDALVPSIVCEWGIVEDIDEKTLEPLVDFEVEDRRGGWERLEWVTDATIEEACIDSERKAKVLIQNSDDSVLRFEEYGTDWIKGIARLSPDAYIQMALQLAWYKTRQEFTATYETALTRMFNRGRTETIRTLTNDSRAFVLAMVDPTVDDPTRHALLRRAIQTHTTLTREAATGRGIDRHLLGLRLMLKPGEGERCELFEDELFERSSRWKLSTSGLSAGHLFRGTGFGAAYDDGYGINYLAAPDILKFGIECKYSNPLTSTPKFQAVLVEALQQMKSIYTTTGSTTFVTSHL